MRVHTEVCTSLFIIAQPRPEGHQDTRLRESKF